MTAATERRPATSEPVTIETAAVTIRVVHVADRPMTIAVYEQLPVDTAMRDTDIAIGFIARCRKRCESFCRNRHVLAARDGEPVLLLLEPASPVERERALSEWRSNAPDYRRRARVLREEAEKLHSRAAENHAHAEVERDEGNAPGGDFYDREAEGFANAARQATTGAATLDARAAELEQWLEEAPRGWASFDAWWAEDIEPLPQLYIAR